MEKIQDLLKKKWFLISVLLIVMLVMLVVLSLQKNPSQLQQLLPSSQTTDQTQTTQFENLSESEKLEQAIAEQTKADEEYVSWKDDNVGEYPWLNKLPLTSDKYYVYFDLDKKSFVARIYPSPGEDIEQIKSSVVQDLKKMKEKSPEDFAENFPENFTFEWVAYEKK